MSTHIPDDSVSKSQAANNTGYIKKIEKANRPELKELNEKITKEFEKYSMNRGEIASRIEEVPDGIKSRPAGEILKKTNLTLTPEMKADLDAGMTIKEFCKKYEVSLRKVMGLD